MNYNKDLHELGDWHEPVKFTSFSTNSTLQRFIKGHHMMVNEIACSQKPLWYILPDNTSHLIFYLLLEKGQLRPSLRLIGPRSHYILISRKNRFFTFITTFRPGAIRYFIDIPVHELTDLAVDAQSVLPRFNDEQLDILKSMVLKNRFSDLAGQIECLLSSSINGLNNQAIITQGFINNLNRFKTVSDSANQLGISERYLRTLTKKFIGHNPKTVLKIERFTKSLSLINYLKDWNSIAYQAGYYDQSHMIAEFQEMVGSSPDKLFK